MNGWRWLGIISLLVFGAARLPLEQSMEAELKAAKFREGSRLPQGPMREKLGQLGVAAALGGFRSFLATIFELQALTAYFDLDYDAVESNYHLTTQLQPRETGYWGMAGWMLESNARQFYLNFDTKHDAAERRRLAERSVQRGKAFLDEGLRYNPDDYGLNLALARYYVYRRGDFCAAEAAFARAADCVKGPGLARRHRAIYLALCPGREREAYAQLREVGEGFSQGKVPGSVALHLRYLERVLQIPEGERFETGFDLGHLYARLRSAFRPGRPYTKLHLTRMHRLEEILDIPPPERVGVAGDLASPLR